MKASFTQATNLLRQQSRDSMFALGSMKLFTLCCRCRPATDFSRRGTATGRRLLSNFLVASSPSLHINKWSFHTSRTFYAIQVTKLYIWCIGQQNCYFLLYQRLACFPPQLSHYSSATIK